MFEEHPAVPRTDAVCPFPTPGFGVDPSKLPRCRAMDGTTLQLRIVPSYIEAGAYQEANCVTLTDGERAAVYVPYALSDEVSPRELSPLGALVKAVQEAQVALAAYLEPSGPGEADTIQRLLAVLDHQDVVRAVRILDPEPGLDKPTAAPEREND